MPAVAAIAPEMSVQRENPTLGVMFREPHQARIGQGHGGVRPSLEARFAGTPRPTFGRPKPFDWFSPATPNNRYP